MADMKQRCFCHDYRERGIYMLTLETADRAPVLGRLDGGKIALSPLGKVVAECWESIPRFHPEVSLIESVVMPDHFHGLLFVRSRMERHLGEVVRGFKIGCTKGMRGMYAAPPNAAPPGASSGRAYMPGDSLFAPGYHDRILTHKGQLATLVAYIRDNPRRLAIRRSNPDFFMRINSLVLSGHAFAAYGNMFLLDRPEKLQVQCSRHIEPETLAAEEARLLDAAERGAVLVSPCISPGERQIARAAMEQGLPLVALVENGFAPRYKPPGKYFDACAAGNLLLLAPWPHHDDTRTITRVQCVLLNKMASDICGAGAADIEYRGIVPAV